MNNAIEIEALTKDFGGLIAVDHISLNVEEGEIFGFLGPNGAGKTTAIKMLCTILNPTSGSARVCGYDVVQQRNEVRECIGIVFQDPTIDTFLTGKVLGLLDLQGKENTQIQHCSGGIQRRFEVARGFLNHPKVLFLDEPTLGLDVQTRRGLWDYIKMLNEEEGTTMILTTHYIEEADYLCHRAAIIDVGKIVALDTPEKLKQAVGLNLISLQVAYDNNRLVDLLKQIAWIKRIEARDSSLELSIDGGEEKIPELIDFTDNHNLVISSIELHKPSLEDAFLHYTGKTIREEEGNLMGLWKAMMTRSRGRR
jgi:ABC-2 type transport system ATP-binding protein